jgi:hypothetical protein
LKDWIAAALGLAGGFACAYAVAAAVLPGLVERSRQPERLVKLAFGGTVVALLPALLLSIVVGAPLGGAIGIALVFALVLLAGTFGGVLLAGLFRPPGA